MIKPTPSAHPPLCCRGVALLAGLVLMAAISLLALVATASMLLQVRMAANFSDRQRARLSATTAVLQGETLIFSLNHDQRLGSCGDHCFLAPLNTVIHYPAELPPFPEYQDSSWWATWSTAVDIDPVSGNARAEAWSFDAPAPRYLIEEIHFENAANLPQPPVAMALSGVAYYRVLGRGQGQGPGSVAVSEAIIARPWSDDSSTDSVQPPNSNFCASFSPWFDCGRMAWRQRR